MDLEGAVEYLRQRSLKGWLHLFDFLSAIFMIYVTMSNSLVLGMDIMVLKRPSRSMWRLASMGTSSNRKNKLGSGELL